MSTQKIFSSKPAQIAHAAIKLSTQIFGEDKKIKIAAIGDKDLVFSITSNFKKYGYDQCRVFKKSNFFYIDSEKKKIIDKKKVLGEFFIYDVILIGFDDGLKVISKEIVKVFLKERKQKPIFFVDVGLPGNIDPEISKISNCYLFDLNDLEQLYSSSIQNNETNNDNNTELFDIELKISLDSFFRKMKFNLEQKMIFEKKINLLVKANGKEIKFILKKFLKVF